MTERDDEDDPQLKSLRAVWLDMRDEDPPEHGLAELMAAARVKATEMREPEPRSSLWQQFASLWRRLASLLRKPPVLALASAMVLLGSVVLIATRGEQMHAEAPSLTAEQNIERAQPASATHGFATDGEDRAVEPARTPAPADQGRADQERAEQGRADQGRADQERADQDRADQGRADQERADQERAATDRAATDRAEENRVAPAAPASTRADPAPGRSKPTRPAMPPPTRDTARATLDDAPTYRREHTRAFDSELSVGGTASPSAEGSTRAPATDATPGATPGAMPGATPDSTPDSTTGKRGATQRSRASQFLAEAKAAATRGDCARAQAWLKRLAAADATAYRKALASEARLRACVAE